MKDREIIVKCAPCHTNPLICKIPGCDMPVLVKEKLKECGNVECSTAPLNGKRCNANCFVNEVVFDRSKTSQRELTVL